MLIMKPGSSSINSAPAPTIMEAVIPKTRQVSNTAKNKLIGFSALSIYSQTFIKMGKADSMEMLKTVYKPTVLLGESYEISHITPPGII